MQLPPHLNQTMKYPQGSNTHPRHSRLKSAFTSIAQLANKAHTDISVTLRNQSRRIALTIAPFLLALPIANAQPAADWMSGQWGIGWRFTADDKSQLANWDVSATVAQVKSIPGVSYVLFNLTDAAHGDAYTAPHSVLTAITPSATPDNDRDLFLEMATAFQAEGIKVIAYVATQGPAMLKHGAEKAFDSVEVSPGVWTSQAMDNWEAYVLAQYGNTTDETYKQAFVEVIMDEYAARYGTLIDGWWFDHSGFANIPLLHDTVTAYNPNAVMAFNDGQKIPLINNNPDYEDYTFGHPTPVASAPASTQQNLPMLTSIEATPSGFFDDAGRESLGHMFMPMSETWNSGAIVWTVAQAADWQERCIKAGGAWTWNVDISPNSSSLRADTVVFMNEVIAEMAVPNTDPVFSATHIAGGTMDMNTAYSGSLASLATDADADTLEFVKVYGPDWLTVASDGTLSGTPDNFAVGMNRSIIVVSDGHGGADVAELEIYVQSDLGDGKAYLSLPFDGLRPDLTSGAINGLGISDANVTITTTIDGDDAILSLSIINQNFDGIGGDNDSLSWDVRVEGFTGGTYTLNGNDSSATLGTSALVGTINNEFGVSGTDLRFVDYGESLQYSVENVVLTTDATATAQFDGFDELWGTRGTFIMGTGTSGLESKTLADNGELSFSAATVLTFTSIGKERLRDPGGDFTIYPNNAPFFVASVIQANGREAIAYSDTLTNLLATATDPDGDALTYSKASGPEWLTVASDGTLSGTPSAADSGLNTFIIQVEDQWSAYDTLILEVTVDLNTPPVGIGQGVTMEEDTIKVVTLTGTDADGDTLTASLAVQPDYGSVSLVGNVATYTPDANFNGSDRFKFRMSDGIVDDIATIVITVNAVNDEPLANAQGLNVNEDGSVAMTLSGSDIDGDSLTYDVATPANGSLSGTAPNLTYTPNANFNGADSFTFTVNDGTANSAAATVSIAVTAVNDAPTASAQGVNVNEDASLAITLSGSDADGDSLTYGVSVPANGSLSGTAPNLTYTPNANFNGADSFTFTVNDGTVDSAAATVSITVTAVNDAPTASAQGASVNEDDSVAITLSGSDTDSDPLTYSTTAPANGSLSGTAPNLTYTPNANYNGADNFTFTVNDGTVDSAAATVSITVTAVNDAPVFSADPISAADGMMDSAYSGSLSATDVDGDSLSYSAVSGPAWLTIASNGSLSGTPQSGDVGSNSWTVAVIDGNGGTDQAVLNVTVTADPIPGIRVTEYYLTTGDFSSTTTTVTLDQNLADDYYILVRGSRTGDEKSFSDNNYARITAVPNGKGELAASGAANQIELSRYVADFEWEGVVTVVECDNSLSDAGFKLVDIVETSLTGTSGTDISTAWSDASQVVLFGGYRGGGASYTADVTSRNQGTSVHTRLSPSGTNTLNWSRDAAGETLVDAVMTTFVVEWGDEWTVQHVNVTGSNGGNGADSVGEYTAASISSVSRANSWVWATGSRADAGIGDCAEACLVTLGDGVSQNATENSVAVGSEYTDVYDFDVYVLTHPDITVDYRYLADGNIHALDLPVAVDTTTAGARFGLVYNGVNGTGTWHPRSIFWARYTADGEVTISRGFDGQNFPAWVQGVDLSGLNN